MYKPEAQTPSFILSPVVNISLSLGLMSSCSESDFCKLREEIKQLVSNLQPQGRGTSTSWSNLSLYFGHVVKTHEFWLVGGEVLDHLGVPQLSTSSTPSRRGADLPGVQRVEGGWAVRWLTCCAMHTGQSTSPLGLAKTTMYFPLKFLGPCVFWRELNLLF